MLKIDKDSIIVEKEERIHILRITEGNYTVDGPPTTGVSEELPFFEPVFSETDPPVDENVPVEELPPFEPVTKSTGPPIDPDILYEDLPEFVPFISDSGPPGM